MIMAHVKDEIPAAHGQEADAEAFEASLVARAWTVWDRALSAPGAEPDDESGYGGDPSR